jgi:hypothetical protein
MPKRKRMYQLVGLPRGPFLRRYGPGMWVYEVRARSIKQAYYLAVNEIMAIDAQSTGVVEIAPPTGPSVFAPYLNSGEGDGLRHLSPKRGTAARQGRPTS